MAELSEAYWARRPMDVVPEVVDVVVSARAVRRKRGARGKSGAALRACGEGRHFETRLW